MNDNASKGDRRVAFRSKIINRMYRRTRVLMGAPMEITALGPETLCAKAVDAAFREVARIEALFSIFRPESPIALVNAAGREGRYRLVPEILEILSCALHYSEMSAGAYDPSSGPLIDLWGFGLKHHHIGPPSDAAIASKRRAVGFQSLKIDEEIGELVLGKRDMSLNLGGIVKGYAIDRAVASLKSYGIKDGLLSFGSSLYALGAPSGKTGWQIGIQDPRREQGVVDLVLLSNRALSTSGDYERCFIHQGNRYSHIIDPRSGYPVKGMASVSVIAQSAMEADALSTAAFVMGKKEGRRLLESQSNVEGLMLSIDTEPSQADIIISNTGGWSFFSTPRVMKRRSFLAMMGILALGVLLPDRANATAIRFASEEEALRKMHPDADGYDVENVQLNTMQHDAAQQLLGMGFREKNYRFWVARKEKKAVGYAVLLNVVGKKRPITFLVGIDLKGCIVGNEVLVYRESKGSEVRYPRFMKQFFGKRREDPLELGREVLPISGATLSSRAATYAVRKSLVLFEIIYRDGVGQ